jgi:CheY-like chemotaxis protein
MEPFFTTKPVGKGTGLGLSMVYGFVKQSGGHLTIYSELGQGTTIGLYFPAVDAAGGSGKPAGTARATTDSGAGRTVLIVEDNAKVRRLTETRLTALGFHCLTAPDADAALEVLASTDDIALVFTDLVMPGTLSGYDLARRISAEYPRVAVLLTSGFSEGVLQDGRIGQEFGILRKPYRQADLARAVYAVLDGG